MQCNNLIKHKVKENDSLYLLAKHYMTTVPMILAFNGNLDPNNLPIGTYIMICPGNNFNPNEYNHMNDSSAQTALIKKMRLVWSQHIYWTRMVLISIAERLSDLSPTLQRLMRNPSDIANVYREYYPEEVARTIEQLLTEHLDIGGELIMALRDGRTREAKILERQWYENADKMAEAFSSINSYYDKEEVRKMLYRHLELTTREVAMRLASDYTADIQAFNMVEEEAMMMADYFTSGIIRQFPHKFY